MEGQQRKRRRYQAGSSSPTRVVSISKDGSLWGNSGAKSSRCRQSFFAQAGGIEVLDPKMPIVGENPIAHAVDLIKQILTGDGKVQPNRGKLSFTRTRTHAERRQEVIHCA